MELLPYQWRPGQEREDWYNLCPPKNPVDSAITSPYTEGMLDRSIISSINFSDFPERPYGRSFRLNALNMASGNHKNVKGMQSEATGP